MKVEWPKRSAKSLRQNTEKISNLNELDPPKKFGLDPTCKS